MKAPRNLVSDRYLFAIDQTVFGPVVTIRLLTNQHRHKRDIPRLMKFLRQAQKYLDKQPDSA